MDRTELSSAIIQEMHGVVEDVLATVVPELLTVDLATLEQRVQQRRERPRPLVGLVGDYVLHRAYYWCAVGKQGAAPLDAALGLGPGDVSPGLARVVARAAVEATVTPAAEQVRDALGATLSDEKARRLAERSGAAAEA